MVSNTILLFFFIQACFCGSWTTIQNNWFGTCLYTISFDNEWLLQNCLGTIYVYKFNGVTFDKLDYTIPYLSQGFQQISLNQFGNFFIQNIGNIRLVKFDRFGYSNISVTGSTFRLQKNGPLMASIGCNEGGNNLCKANISKFNGTGFQFYGPMLIVPFGSNTFQFSDDGSQIFMSYSSTTDGVVIFEDNGVGFSQRYLSNMYIRTPSFCGKYFTNIQNSSNTVKLTVYKSTTNATLYNTFNTGLSYTAVRRTLFNTKDQVQYLILLVPYSNQTKIVIYKDDGVTFALFDQFSHPQNNSAGLYFDRGLAYVISYHLSTGGVNTLYLYCSIPNCTSCIGKNTCGACATGTTKVNGLCILCSVPNCLLCSSDNNCSKCQTGFTATLGLCVPCNVTSCYLCSTINICSLCLANFTLSESSCVQCRIPNCSQCNSTDTCISCSGSLTLLDNTCLSCTIANCVSCTVSDVCSSCNPSFSLSAGSCIACSVNNCIGCSSTNICSLCQPSFSLQAGLCVSCNVSNCLFCNSSDLCTVCRPHHTVSQGSCISCSISNCLQCISADYCAVCELNFNTLSGSCIRCNITNCYICNQTNSCTSCLPTYTLYQSQCFSCNIIQCSLCNASNTCFSCKEGYNLTGNLCMSVASSNTSLSNNSSSSTNNSSYASTSDKSTQNSLSSLPSVAIVGAVSGGVILVLVIVILKIKSGSAVVAGQSLHNVSEIKITEMQEIKEGKKRESATVEELKKQLKKEHNRTNKKSNQFQFI